MVSTMASNQVQSSKKLRTWTAVIQGVYGLVAIGCGIALILLTADGPSIPHYVEYLSTVVSNVGFAIWGGVIISITAVLGLIYREKKAMISIYAAFSLVSVVIAVMLVTVAIFGLQRFATLDYAHCYRGPNNPYVYASYRRDYGIRHQCCFERYTSDCDPYAIWSGVVDPHQAIPTTSPRFDYDSAECRRVRQTATEECRETVRKAKLVNMSIYGILLLVSATEFIVGLTAAVLSFIVVCRGCCNNSPPQVIYLSHPANGQPGAAPMVQTPSMDPEAPRMPRQVPNTMTPFYPPQMAVMNPSSTTGLYPYPTPYAVPPGFAPGQAITVPDNAVADETMQRQATAPSIYPSIYVAGYTGHF